MLLTLSPQQLLIIGNIGPYQLLVIVLVVFLFFGARRIPELMRSLGSGMREFKKGVRGDDDEETASRRIDGGDETREK